MICSQMPDMTKLDDGELRAALGQVLMSVREARDLRQGDVADQTTVSKMESGVNFPSWPTLLQLCRRYRVKPSEILAAAEALLDAKEGTEVRPIEADAAALLKLFEGCTAEGKRLMLDRARAVRTLFPK